MRQRWPARIWVVRHGQSAGNVARDAADAAGLEVIDVATRDVDVPLSALGEQQANALGHWYASLPVEERPEVILTSPYIRAQQTASRIRDAFDPALAVCADERLREKEFGILDGLTTHGIRARHPEQAQFRSMIGKFYHRPPGGESWCDVIARLRSAMDTISLHHADKRVLIVGHQVVVLCMRYILENMTEAQILGIDREADVANCGVTEYAFEPDCADDCKPEMTRYNFVAPLEAEATPVTREPDAKAAAA